MLAADLPDHPSWYTAEYDFKMNASRWGKKGDLPVEVSPPLGPGKYSFHMIALRIKDGETKDLQIKFPWKTEVVPIEYSPVNPVVEFEVPAGEELKTIYLEFPTVMPKDIMEGSVDARQLSICYNGSWIEPR